METATVLKTKETHVIIKMRETFQPNKTILQPQHSVRTVSYLLQTSCARRCPQNTDIITVLASVRSSTQIRVKADQV